MLITFIASFYITFVLLYGLYAYKAYRRGQKAAAEMLQYNTYHQVQGYASRLKQGSPEEAWFFNGFMSCLHK
jgi:hypothetical protein